MIPQDNKDDPESLLSNEFYYYYNYSVKEVGLYISVTDMYVIGMTFELP